MRFFKEIKKNEVKESKEQIQKNVTSKDLQEQHKKALNRYRRHMKEYDEEQTQEKYKELIEVHTELKQLEKQIEELGYIDNELNDNDFDVKSEDINESEEERQANKEKLPEDFKQMIEIAEEIFKQNEEIETVPEEIVQPAQEETLVQEITEPVIHENNSNVIPEEMIAGDDGITRPKSMHDQIEANKCLFCDEKFGFTDDWNIHMMKDHPGELIEHNKKEIERLQSEYKIENNLPKEPVPINKIVDDIFDDAMEHSQHAIQNESETKLKPTNEQYDIPKEDPDLFVIQEIMKKNNITTKEQYDNMMNNLQKNSPYAINHKPDLKPLVNEPQIIPDQIKEIAEKPEILNKSVTPTEAIINLDEIIPKKKEHIPKVKFTFPNIFQKKKYSKLKGIEAYCNICKHTIQQHEYLGKSEGCVKCGCLKTVQEILEINEVDLKYGEEKPVIDNGIYCICGHSQLTHKDHSKFCEVEDCHCVRFRIK